MEKPLFRRRITTVVALLLISLGTLGIFLNGLNFLGLYTGASYGFKLTMSEAWTSLALSTLPKLGLFVTGIALLRRSLASMFFLMTSFFLSVADSVYQLFVTVPPQLAQISQEGARFGFIIGIYSMSFFALVLYVSVFFFLKNRGTQAELESSAVLNQPDQAAPELNSN